MTKAKRNARPQPGDIARQASPYDAQQHRARWRRATMDETELRDLMEEPAGGRGRLGA